MKIKLPKLLKTVFKYMLIVLLGFITYVLVITAVAYIPVNTEFEACTEDCVDVYLRSNGVHTDLVLPVTSELKDWTTHLDSKKTKGGKTGFKYVGIGWGDKGFYLDTPTWGDLTAKTAFNALFYLSSSAMHVTFYTEMIEGERCKKVSISKAQYLKMLAFMESSFQTTASSAYILIPNASYGKNDLFFEAKGRYSLFYTCNTWTNNCLKAADMKACLWTLFDKGIFYHYQ
jgi:uncharacterized protein (TIGR02117 family)